MRFLHSSSSKMIWILVSIFLMFSVTIGVVGYFLFQIQKRQARKAPPVGEDRFTLID